MARIYKLTPEQAKEALVLFNQGIVKQDPLARAIGVSKQSVANWLKSQGIGVRAPLRDYPQVAREAVRGLKKPVYTDALHKLRAYISDTVGISDMRPSKLKRSLLKKGYKTVVTRVPTDSTRTFTADLSGVYYYQLQVSGNYRYERDGTIEYQTHYSKGLHTDKNFDECFEEAMYYAEGKDTNWVLISDVNDKDYVKIKIRWRRYGGRKGISPARQRHLDMYGA